MKNSQLQSSFNRRGFLQGVAATAITTCLSNRFADAGDVGPQSPMIGFSLYGMKSLPIVDALRVCSEIGYECVELPVMADWPGAPEQLTARQRSELSDGLSQRGLKLAALMENLPLAVDGDKHRDNLDRIDRAFELFQNLEPNQPPLIETVLGGSPDKWPMLRQTFLDRLRDWTDIAAKHKGIIAIKAHIAGALHMPQDAVDLVQAINSPSLQLTFDQSHFQLRDVPLADSWKAMSQRTRFVHVKDGRGKPGAFQFLLPGDGTIDYVELFRLLTSSQYSGSVVVEVSGQLFSKADYDPIAAAKKCWPVLRDARQKALAVS